MDVPRAVYRPMTLARHGTLLAGADESLRWRLVAEFLEEYRWEPVDTRHHLLEEEPIPTGDEHWTCFWPHWQNMLQLGMAVMGLLGRAPGR